MLAMREASSDYKFMPKEPQTQILFEIPKLSLSPVQKSIADESYPTDVAVRTQFPTEVPTGRLSEIQAQVPVVERILPVKVGPLATVIQIWEGIVSNVDLEQNQMTVKLNDRQGIVPSHTAQIGLDWVVRQDMDLVRPGAVFYWTIYKETKTTTIRHSQEIRFRRLPNWTSKQVATIYSKADAFLAKVTSDPVAADY